MTRTPNSFPPSTPTYRLPAVAQVAPGSPTFRQAAATAATGVPTATLGIGNGLAGIVATALVTVITCVVVTFGKDLLYLRWTRWIVKTQNMDPKFTPAEVVQMILREQQTQSPAPASSSGCCCGSCRTARPAKEEPAG
jgi:hypothetical protein